MAEYSGFINGTYGKPQKKIFLDKRKREFLLSKTIDFAQQNLSAGSSDILNIMSIPADTWVKEILVNVVTAETASGTIDIGDGTDADFFGNGLFIDATGYVAPALTASATWNAGSLDIGEREASTVTVNGAALGDYVMVSHSVDVSDLTISAQVTAADTVTILLANAAGDTVITGGSTWNPASLLPGETAAQNFTVTGAALGDFVEAAMGVDVTDLIVDAQVTATNVVTVTLTNNKEGAVYVGGSTWNPATIADGDEAVQEFTVTGAALGDFVEVSSSIDVVDLALVAQVTATNTVTVQLNNNTGGNLDLGATTINLRVVNEGAAIDLASNTVNIRVRTEGAAINLASATADVTVLKSRAMLAGGKVYTSADTIDVTVTSDAAAVDIDGALVLFVARCVDMNKID